MAFPRETRVCLLLGADDVCTNFPIDCNPQRRTCSGIGLNVDSMCCGLSLFWYNAWVKSLLKYATIIPEHWLCFCFSNLIADHIVTFLYVGNHSTSLFDIESLSPIRMVYLSPLCSYLLNIFTAAAASMLFEKPSWFLWHVCFSTLVYLHFPQSLFLMLLSGTLLVAAPTITQTPESIQRYFIYCMGD